MKTNFQLEQNYTFADYFKLNYEPEDILGYFGYELQLQNLALPRYIGELDYLQSLQQRIEESLPHISLTSEMARREFLIAPMGIFGNLESSIAPRNRLPKTWFWIVSLQIWKIYSEF